MKKKVEDSFPLIIVIVGIILIGSSGFMVVNVTYNNLAMKNAEVCLSFESGGINDTCSCWENSLKISKGKEMKKVFEGFLEERECFKLNSKGGGR